GAMPNDMHELSFSMRPHHRTAAID
ncbi:hypothetical protein V3C99_006136, partial [Haemonchus contortus]